MINAYFSYNNKKILIQCNLDEKMRFICQRFATKAQINVDSKIYIYDNKTLSINPNLNLSFGEQINSKDINDKEIMVLDDRDKEFTLKFTYNGEQKEIKVNEEENFLSILSKLGTMFVDKKNKVMAIYNGGVISEEDEKKPIGQILKPMDREDKKGNLLLEDVERNSITELKEINGLNSINNNLNDNENNNNNNNNNNDNENNNNNNNNNNDNNKKDKFLVKRNYRESVIFLLKINLNLFIQFLLIELLTFLGLYFNINNIFIKDIKSMNWTFILISIIILIATFFVMIYEKGVLTKCIKFNIIIFIPCITIYLFLLSNFIENRNIIIILSLINLCFISKIILTGLFRRYKGIGYLILYLIFSISFMIIYHKKINMLKKEEISYISVTAALFFSYTLLFNNISKTKFEDDEIIATIFHFDYIIFLPFEIISIFALIIAILLIVFGFLLAAFAILGAIMLIILIFKI